MPEIDKRRKRCYSNYIRSIGAKLIFFELFPVPLSGNKEAEAAHFFVPFQRKIADPIPPQAGMGYKN